MDVFVVHHDPGDTLGPSFRRHAARRLRWPWNPGQIIDINNQWSMHTICRRVRELTNDQVGVLYLLSHGNQGQVMLGQGMTQDRCLGFRQLRGCWVGEQPRIEVHACLVVSATPAVVQPAAAVSPAARAAGACATEGTESSTGTRICVSAGTLGEAAPGNVLMETLANEAGVVVMAAAWAQIADREFEYEGPVRWYRPNVYYHQPPNGRRQDPPRPYNRFAADHLLP